MTSLLKRYWRDFVRFIFDLVLIVILILQWRPYEAKCELMQRGVDVEETAGSIRAAKRPVIAMILWLVAGEQSGSLSAVTPPDKNRCPVKANSWPNPKRVC